MNKEKKQKIEKRKQVHGVAKPAAKAFPVWMPAAILILTVLVYLPVFNAGFVNWDDTTYIRDNALIRTIDLRAIFSTYQLGNYHPLTMLVYAIEYQLWGLNETGYHAMNLLLHLLNTMLVFYIIYQLAKKTEVAFIASLLFGIHPLHVESVAWLAELKDLLYTFFFLASYFCYLRFSLNGKSKYYAYALILFLLSLLSKAMAASLPIVFLLTDYFTGRKFSGKTLLEKTPFFILAVGLGIVAVFAQQSSDSIANIEVYPFWQRIIFASYGFMMYLFHLLLPVQLNAIYPYPENAGNGLPVQYYLCLVLLVALAIFVFNTLRNSKKIIFGVGFFAITVFLVLQLLPVGDAVMADRYSYIPSIGIFYLAGEGCYLLWNTRRRNAAIFLTGAFTLFFSIQTYARCGAWKDGLSLWDDVISKDATVEVAYNNRGGTLQSMNRFDEALRDYNKAIELRPLYADAYCNRGIILADRKKNDEALADYNKAIELNPKMITAYNNRGLLYLEMKKNSEARADFEKALQLKPGYAEAYYNRGLLAMDENKNEEAFSDYSKAIQLQPAYVEAYINRGVLMHTGKKYDEALIDYNKALQLQPGNSMVYFNKGLIFNIQKRFSEAANSFTRAIELQPDYAQAFYNRGIAKISSGNVDDGCNDMKQAITLGFRPQPDEYNRKCY